MAKDGMQSRHLGRSKSRDASREAGQCIVGKERSQEW